MCVCVCVCVYQWSVAALSAHSWWCGIAAVLFGLWMKLYYIVPSWCWDGWPSSSRYIVLVCNQPSRSAQPSVLVVERLVANCYTPFTLLFYFALLTDWQQETSTRRWSSLQSRDFGSLHATLATLILNCDVSHAYTVGEVFAVLWVSLRPIPNVLVVCICILCIHMHWFWCLLPVCCAENTPGLWTFLRY